MLEAVAPLDVHRRALSSSGGIHTAVDRAEAVGAESLQVFTQSPRTWRPTNHDPASFDRFRERREEVGLARRPLPRALPCNLAATATTSTRSRSPRSATRWRSPTASAPTASSSTSAHISAPGFEQDRARVAGDGAGARAHERHDVAPDGELRRAPGGTIGRSIEELATIYERLDRHPRLGICLDSCHLYASGIDVADARALDALLDEVDASIGLDRLRALHVNDSASAARLEPRPAREHRRGLLGEKLGVFLGKPAPAGPAGCARDRGPDKQRPGRERGPKGEGDSRTRYRWVILARRHARPGDLLRASPSGCPRSRPRCARTIGSRSARPASCSAPSASACSSRCCRGGSSPTG